MKLLVIFCCAFVFIEADEVLWKEFKKRHNKIYNNIQEERQRYWIFQENLQKIEDHNAKYENGESTWYMKITKFADKTEREFKAWISGSFINPQKLEGTKHYEKDTFANLPDAFDWRDHGAVLDVRDQGDCLSCWAFSSTGALEGQNVIKRNVSILLSAQQLVDCSWLQSNAGCGGGDMVYAIQYAIHYGVEAENDYSYVGEDEQCKYNGKLIVIQPWSQRQIFPSETVLQTAVANIGPISAALDASLLSLYGGGIYTNTTCSSTDLNQAVLIIGYGSENETDYWNVKNSWGEDWGENGFFRIGRNLGISNGLCGISSYLTYPILKNDKKLQ